MQVTIDYMNSFDKELFFIEYFKIVNQAFKGFS